jgi:hypothetical protein
MPRRPAVCSADFNYLYDRQRLPRWCQADFVNCLVKDIESSHSISCLCPNLIKSFFSITSYIIFEVLMMILPKPVLLALLPFFLQANAQSSGSETTTCYRDCCKASCGWTSKISLASGSNPVQSCDRNDRPLSDYNAESGCESGGAAYMCSNQSPWAVSDTLSYGFAATTVAGGTESSWRCACYELTFTSGPVAGKKLVVQTTNTGNDLSSNQFDLAVSPSSGC